MLNLILFDPPQQQTNLLPLTFTRPIGDLRVGILTIRQKWEKYLRANVSFLTQDYLAEKFPTRKAPENLLVNGSLLPNPLLCEEIESLKIGQMLVSNENILAFKSDSAILFENFNDFQKIQTQSNPLIINNLWDIFGFNDRAIADDFELLTQGRTSRPIPSTNRILGDENRIFLEEGASVEASILNVQTGVIYLAKDAEIMEGCLIRGALAMGEHATLKMGAKIYGATTVGEHCKVGGEVSNSVLMGYSNKGHEGFLGNSVLGEWCNLGADTNNSNLKNNYSLVKLWNYTSQNYESTGLQFCGLIMGDHSKSGINTMFNTGTVVGVAANIFGADYPANFLPSFTWGGVKSSHTFRLDKVFEMAEAMMGRRKVPFTPTDQRILERVFEMTAPFRTWEK